MRPLGRRPGIHNPDSWVWIPGSRLKEARPGMTGEWLLRLELQRRRVDAVAQAARAGTVLEDVAEMAVAFRAEHLGADHAVADVALLVDMGLRRRRGKARPAASGIEFGVGFEQGLPAAGADIGALALLMLVFAGERPLRSLFPQHRILHRRQFAAPLRFGFFDFGGFGVGHVDFLCRHSGMRPSWGSRFARPGMTGLLVGHLRAADQRR